jgi:hypothetical protein
MNHFLVNQATPRFELGKEDLKSPALPLGHVVKNFEKKKIKKKKKIENLNLFGGVNHS